MTWGGLRAAGTPVRAFNAALMPAVPAATQVGDTLICYSGMVIGGVKASSLTSTGWTLIAPAAGDTTTTCIGLWARTATGSDSLTLDWGTIGTDSEAFINAYIGGLGNVTAIVHAVAGYLNNGNAIVDYPALTVTVNNCLILIAATKNVDSSSYNGSWNTVSGFNLDNSKVLNNFSPDMACVINSQIQTTATSLAGGGTPSQTMTASDSTNRSYSTVAVALLPGDQSLALAEGSFSISGQPLNISSGGATNYVFLMAPGSFVIDGEPAFSDFQIDMVQGAYSLVGEPVGLFGTQAVAMNTGLFAMNGQPLVLVVGYFLGLGQGAFVLSGQAVNIFIPTPVPAGGGKPGGRVILNPKKLGETSNYTFDFISTLAPGETILTGVVMAEVFSGTDPAPSSIIDSTAAIVGTQLQQKITGGVLGVIYEVLAIATTNLGNTLEISGYLVIAPDLI